MHLRLARVRNNTAIDVYRSEEGMMPRHIELNLHALHRHAPAAGGFRVVALNASSIGAWLTLPPEFGRLKHKVAASDVARIGLLARYGGIYVDADVLVAQPLAPIVALLDEYEHVLYSTKGQQCTAGVCASARHVATARTRLRRL